MNHKEKIQIVYLIKDRIENDYKNIMSISELAEEYKIDCKSLSENFYYLFKYNPQEYLNIIRVKAFEREVIKDGGNKKLYCYARDIGLNCGSSLNYLITKYKDKTPAEYIREIKKERLKTVRI